MSKDYIYKTNRRRKPRRKQFRNKLFNLLTLRIELSPKVQTLVFFLSTYAMWLVLIWLGVIYEV